MAVNVVTYTSFEDAKPIAAEWDSFMALIDAEIFLCFTWLEIWWKYYGKNSRLRIFVFRKQDAIIGIVPLVKIAFGPAFFRINVVRLAGMDYLPATMVMPIATASLDEVVPLLHKELLQWEPWRLLHFGPISGAWHDHSDEFTDICKSSFPKAAIRKRACGIQTYFEIPPTWEEYLLRFNHKRRNILKRTFKNLKNRGLEVIPTTANEGTFPSIFESFVQMHQKYWQSRKQLGHFADWPDSYGFHREAAAALLREDRLRLYQLQISDEVIGFSYAYKFGRTYYCFLDARTVEGSAKNTPFAIIDMYNLMQRAREEGVVRFDSMRGDYHYKRLLGGIMLPVQNIYIAKRFSPGLLLFRLIVTLWHIAYLKIWRKRLARQLKPFQKFWIRTNSLSWY